MKYLLLHYVALLVSTAFAEDVWPFQFTSEELDLFGPLSYEEFAAIHPAHSALHELYAKMRTEYFASGKELRDQQLLPRKPAPALRHTD